MLELIFILFFNFMTFPIFNSAVTHTEAPTVQTSVYSSSSENNQVYITPVPAATPDITPIPQPTPGTVIPKTPEPVPTPQEEEKEMNYIEELTKLGYINNDYEDRNVNIRNGVLKFQADSNLEADGIYGPLTAASLKKRIKDADFKYTDKIENPPSKDYWILINKSRRILTLYKGTDVVKKYPVAVGNPPSLTPEGHFKIVIKVIDPVWGGGGYAQPVAGGIPENPLGYRWMGLDLGGGGEYGIHGNNAPYSIGTNASHGCVRMINSDVESLYEIVSEETPVWIGSEDFIAKNGITQDTYRLD